MFFECNIGRIGKSILDLKKVLSFIFISFMLHSKNMEVLQMAELNTERNQREKSYRMIIWTLGFR